MVSYIKTISLLTGISERCIGATIKLLQEGSTIPFISRYRKEVTGNLDEVQILSIEKEWKRLDELEKRKETIKNSITDQGKMTSSLQAELDKIDNIIDLEDFYLPFKPKRKTRGSVAIERGLEPLAQLIYSQKNDFPEKEAQKFLSDQVESIEQALQGASDIIAEWINENKDVRQKLRNFFEKEGVVYSKVAKGKEEEAVKYSDYFEFNEKASSCPSHRMLAIRRGEAEGMLKISLKPDEDLALKIINRQVLKGYGKSTAIVKEAAEDSYKRLLQPSLENEVKKTLKEKADKEAIDVFAKNLYQLLMSSPLGRKRVLAIDPGFRTGCKVVCLNELGDLLHNETIYPNPPQREDKMAAKKILSLVNSHKIQAIAIGNGTASRETESFIRNVRFETDIQVFVVSENGASVYSASAVAREEFPNYDVTVRGAVSIGRRLIDPLAELVKIDPKSIGVGQYQHDVDQTQLKESLEFTVERCVNQVGVNINTASKHLLSYVSGLGPKLAQNIVDYRSENGPFISRQQIKNVPRMGDKAFEQCAGFLRVPDSKNPLDNSSVHPESYRVVEKMAKEIGCNVAELTGNKSKVQSIDIQKFVDETIGLLTLKDILTELEKPGRDPRSAIKVFEFDSRVHNVEDLEIGMVLPGIVTNITNFGAFVDIGVHQDGLVHISQLADRFISNPSDVVALHQHLTVKVIEVDVARKRIQLTMKGL